MRHIGLDEGGEPVSLIQQGRPAIDKCIDPARAGEHPRHAMPTEVVAIRPVHAADDRLALRQLESTGRDGCAQRIGA